MLRSVKDLEGYAIQARDGQIGHIDDLYFDDQFWVTRYLVVETGGLIAKNRVLISPLVLEEPNWESHTLSVDLTREQVEESPSIDTARPFSRRQEAELHRHYGWRHYWRSSVPPARAQAGRLAKERVGDEIAEQAAEGGEDVHLRQGAEVMGCHVWARDGQVGHVANLVVNNSSWVIHYLVVDTGILWAGKKVLIAPAWVEKVNWLQRIMRVGLLADTIRESPEYDPSALVSRAYEAQLYDYYGRPKYWEG